MKAELKKPVVFFEELGAESDDNPKHWDAALMISGYNFWTVPKRGKSKGKRVTAAMGLAAVDGMCDPRGRYNTNLMSPKYVVHFIAESHF